DHLDATHPAERSPVTVRELLRRMIDRSSNEATDHVLTLIGLDAVAEAIAGLGLSGTRVERLIGDAAAIERDLTNETTPADLVATVRALVAPHTGEGRGADGRGTWLSPSSRELAREALAAQQIPIIATALRPGVPVGSKSGWVDGYRHDVAVIGDPRAPAGQGSGAGHQEARYLAVMTSGMSEAEADAAIRERVRALLPQLADCAGRSGSGLAPAPAPVGPVVQLSSTRRAPAYSPVGSYSVSDMISTLREALGACMIRSSPRYSATCRIESPPGSVAKNTRSPRRRSSRSSGVRPEWFIWSPASRPRVMPWWWNKVKV